MKERIVLASLALLIGLYYLLISPWGIAFLLIFALSMTLLLTSNIVIQLKYIREAKNDEVRLHVTALYGLVDVKYRVPVIKLKGMAEGIKLKMKRADQAEAPASRKVYSRDDISRFVHNTRELIRHIKDFKEWVAGTLGRIHVERIRWKTRFGLGDAPETAIAYGVVWSLKSSLLSRMLLPFSLETKPELSVEPVYNEVCFQTEAEAKMRINVFHLLLGIVMLAARVARKKKNLKVWRRVLLQVNAK
ncbi:DUF2953 domain-containing protein [Paenibacillus thermotolerans]|uniref:DUF2953 domain-containing protein n=1 Tax=Paenibacillus thermotolerans TaxID=3027807 RepID=UPI0023685311|nr:MULTISPECIES: DUF2953 domain-containing protein [unclassified Paenibacillus]